jgi:hypothetical protein
LWGRTYVDAVKPVATAVNAKLRKALLLSREIIEGVDALFILDDRVSREKADSEISVLGSVAKAIRYSDFERFYDA